MPHLTDAQLKEALRAVKDPKQRQLLADIAIGKVAKLIHCLSTTCNNRVIGQIYANGQVHPVKDQEEDQYYLRSSRQRLDGFLGFECWCGNDSRIAPQEKGHLDRSGNPPSKEQLHTIFGRVASAPSQYPTINHIQTIDGFAIEEIT